MKCVLVFEISGCYVDMGWQLCGCQNGIDRFCDVV